MVLDKYLRNLIAGIDIYWPRIQAVRITPYMNKKSINDCLEKRWCGDKVDNK